MKQSGVTLVEMLVTISLVALAASLAIPSAAPVSSFAAEAVAGEVVRALRFAQREAVRTNTWQVVRIDPADQSLSVYVPLTDSSSFKAQAVHPVDKSPYKIAFASGSGTRGRLAVVEFKYEDSSIRNYIGFNPEGLPAVQDGTNFRQLKFVGKVVIRHGHVEREIAVQPHTGRVTQ
jgi:prepilin-type N-terminal cleavage/methylation domain-containing protein